MRKRVEMRYTLENHLNIFLAVVAKFLNPFLGPWSPQSTLSHSLLLGPSKFPRTGSQVENANKISGRQSVQHSLKHGRRWSGVPFHLPNISCRAARDDVFFSTAPHHPRRFGSLPGSLRKGTTRVRNHAIPGIVVPCCHCLRWR